MQTYKELINIYIVQNIFNQGKETRNISLDTQPRTQAQITY
jgi:hypothetical protein